LSWSVPATSNETKTCGANYHNLLRFDDWAAERAMTELAADFRGRPEATRAATRGARRLLRELGHAVLAEFPLPSGGRVDLVALTETGALYVVEVKSSHADFRADLKWRGYLSYCDRFYFAIPPEVEAQPFPMEAGLILADAHGGALARESPVYALAPARRRALLVRFGQLAAERLHSRLYREEG
jgi:hypothetical protein